MGLTVDDPLSADQLEALVESCGLGDGRRVKLWESRAAFA